MCLGSPLPTSHLSIGQASGQHCQPIVLDALMRVVWFRSCVRQVANLRCVEAPYVTLRDWAAAVQNPSQPSIGLGNRERLNLLTTHAVRPGNRLVESSPKSLPKGKSGWSLSSHSASGLFICSVLSRSGEGLPSPSILSAIQSPARVSAFAGAVPLIAEHKAPAEKQSPPWCGSPPWYFCWPMVC